MADRHPDDVLSGSDPPLFGDLLRAHRLAAGLTQEELAERAGLSRRGISDLERGARTRPYRETLKLLADALGLESQQRRAFLAAARDGASPHRGAEPFSGTPLPVPPNPLVGRSDEVAAATALLCDPALRLLTMTGAGGSGKTRLAIETANQLQSDFPDGVVFVDLAPVADAALVPGAIAAALKARERPGRSLAQSVGEALATRCLLLVLDNFEHLLPAAVMARDLLLAAPNLKILATSRARLALTAEQEFPVPPLAVPDPESLPPLDRLGEVAAVRLFVDRARGLDPGFALTEENAPSVAVICQRLDGMPLAIELAAARMKLLPPAELLARLERSLPLLTGGARDVPERQRTLRNTIAWSHDLLSEEERVLFRRLSVFAGGWTLEAAEAVTNLDGDLDVLDGMTSLVDKNLVRRIEQPGGEPRFAMLETVREFARELLGQHAGEEAALRRAHAYFYAALARDVELGIYAGFPAAVGRMRTEEDNLRAMLTHLLDACDAETELRVAGGILSEFWFATGGHFSEGRAWLDRALRQGGAASPAARGWGLYGLTVLAVFQGDVETASTAGLECYTLARMADDPLLATRGPQAFYMAEEAGGRADAAIPIAAEAVTAARALGDPVHLGWALLILGNARWRTGDLSEAVAALEEGLALFRTFGSDWGQAEILTNLARIAWTEGNLGRAARRHGEALAARRAFGELVSVYDDLIGLAVIAQALGRNEAAARLLGAEDRVRAFSGYAGFAETPVWRQQTQQALLERLGAQRFEAAWESGRTLSTAEAIDEALVLADDLAFGRR